jgi:hypothetical protein
MYHPRLSTVAQLLLPEEAAIIRRENCEKWTMLKDIRRPIIFIDDILTLDVMINSTELAPFLIVARLCLYYQRCDHQFYPHAIITHNPSITQLTIWFSAGIPDATFSILQQFTPDMNYNIFIEHVIREIQAVNE